MLQTAVWALAADMCRAAWWADCFGAAEADRLVSIHFKGNERAATVSPIWGKQGYRGSGFEIWGAQPDQKWIKFMTTTKVARPDKMPSAVRTFLIMAGGNSLGRPS